MPVIGRLLRRQANFLRVMLIEDNKAEKQMYVVEANIDDSTGEELGLTMEKLLAVGAADVHFVPCFMKKNRPAYILRVIAEAEKISAVEDVIFRNTSTIGLRKYPVERSCMERKIISVQLPEGEVEVKKCWRGDIVRYYPEFESVKKVAEQSGRAFRDLYNQANRLAEEEDK